MGFLDMGMGEILLVIVVALVIWGPGKLPEIARTMGKAVATLRKASFDLTTEIRKEIEKEEQRKTTETPPEMRIDGGIKNWESTATGIFEADSTGQDKSGDGEISAKNE
ncbi:Sec-independent protein translocase protein TatB [Chloroflexota bacterium]